MTKLADRDVIASQTTVDVDSMTLAARDDLCDEMFVVHDQIFAGMTREEFDRYLFHSDADRTRIRLYRNLRQELVGYAAMHQYRRKVAHRWLSVFRAEAGLLPAYRGQDTTFSFYAGEFVRCRLRRPLERLFFLGMLLHPSSYLGLARVCYRVYPRYDRPTPPQMHALMANLADLFGVPPVADDPLIRNVGVSTRQDRPFWSETNLPDVAFFRERNPGFRQGHGLVTLVPLTLVNVVLSFVLHRTARYRRRFSEEHAGV